MKAFAIFAIAGSAVALPALQARDNSCPDPARGYSVCCHAAGNPGWQGNPADPNNPGWNGNHGDPNNPGWNGNHWDPNNPGWNGNHGDPNNPGWNGNHWDPNNPGWNGNELFCTQAPPFNNFHELQAHCAQQGAEALCCEHPNNINRDLCNAPAGV